MPCITEPTAEELREPAITRGISCAALTFIAKMYESHEGDAHALDTFLATTNWKEIGISKREVREWWKNHLKQDTKRKAEEKAEAESIARVKANEEARLQASKLRTLATASDDELAAVGLVRVRGRDD